MGPAKEFGIGFVLFLNNRDLTLVGMDGILEPCENFIDKGFAL
jgi:hypothetical protein